MTQWRFYLDALQIQEPIGFDDVVFNVHRDDQWHGMIFEATTSSLKFYGVAFDYLKDAKLLSGVDANVIFKVESRCEGETTYTEELSGKLNFARYQETCGTECLITLPVEQDDCTMLLRNRFDQKVSVDSVVAFDKQTILPLYTRLGFNMNLATQQIPVGIDANVDTLDTGTMEVSGTVCDTLIRPIYATVRDNSIKTGQLDAGNFWQDCSSTFLLTPQVLLEENNECLPVVVPYLSNYHSYGYTIRLKGTIKMSIVIQMAARVESATLVLAYWGGNGDIMTNQTIISSQVVNADMANNVTYSFDHTFSGSAVLPNENGVYAYLKFSFPFVALSVNVYSLIYTFDGDTSFLFTAVKQCPPTVAKVYMVNELLSRLTEAITNRCLTVKSDYFGRVNSQPYASTVNGCGSHRVLTSGLRIRQENTKEFFTSLKDVLTGLNGIDNLGMGIEADRLRIEPMEYFYNNTLLMSLPLIPKMETQIEEKSIYSLIKIGYKKWEIKSVKGIDEFNSLKEFRTGVTAISNTLDASSDLIASGYIIEELRTQTLANTGDTDNTYDNDVFIIVVEETGYGEYQVEQGITSGAQMFSPTTAYNWRIRPFYNLMRWAKSIFGAYSVLVNTTSKIFFSSGTGNYLATGTLTDDCRLETGALPENTDLSVGHFRNGMLPVLKSELSTFDYPLTRAQYQEIKTNPYGYINLQCGVGDYVPAYIKSMEYSPVKGLANFTFKLKWQ